MKYEALNYPNIIDLAVRIKRISNIHFMFIIHKTLWQESWLIFASIVPKLDQKIKDCNKYC